MKKILPMTLPEDPTFPVYADLLSILYSYDVAHDWIYSNFIQIYALDIVNRDASLLHPFLSGFFGLSDTRRFDMASDDMFFLPRDGICPFLTTFEIPNDVVEDSMSSFIKGAINRDYYIFTFIDVMQISEYNMSRPYSHGILVYGFDDSEEVFHVADFLLGASGRYTFFKCSYVEMEEAIKFGKLLDLPYLKTSALIQFSKYGQHEIDFDSIKAKIQSYIYPDSQIENEFSDYCTYLYSMIFDWNVVAHLGTNVYQYLSSFIDTELELGKTRIDYRLFHAMYEHKLIMIRRLEHLKGKGLLSDKDKYIVSYSAIRDNLSAIRNSLLKYNISKKSTIITSVKQTLNETRELEINLLKKIFDIV